MLCMSIDFLIDQFSISVPNHIKIDVDGIEFSILKGAVQTLSSPNLKSILVESQNKREEEKLCEYLKQHGFYLTEKFLASHINQESFNCLFKRTRV